MEKPVLVVLAAGMGSRYGGLKQIDPVGPDGELIIDYSLYDARKAGFERVIFIIKREIEEDFKAAIGRRMEKQMQVDYAFQELDKLPAGFAVPKGRVKPWGTSHALLCAKEFIHGPMAVINSDDYYGPEAFETLYAFLTAPHPGPPRHYAMVGYQVENTVTQHGSVTRGVCKANAEGFLTGIVETYGIEQTVTGARAPDNEDGSWQDFPAGTLVSMNFWGLDESFLTSLEEAFPAFLEESIPQNPQRCEYLLPSSVQAMIESGEADVRVLSSPGRWWGVTYQEDKPAVADAMAEKHRTGQYPTPLWG